MAKKKINFMCTAFRDGFQSVYGARVFTKDFMPAVEAAREAGIKHFEAGGGARFQALYFYTNEDAFAMMDEFRRVAGPDANLQTLSRGVNVVGLDSQPRDIIKLHAQMFKKHGMTTIRNFDALNDVNNLIDSGKAIHDAGLKHEVTITMMSLPDSYHAAAHNPDFYEKVDRRNPKRVIHAVEICRMTGQPYSSLRTETKKERPFDIVKIGLTRPRAELYERINSRVDAMMRDGLEAEARKLYPYRHLNALNTVGYKEMFAYFDGTYDLPTAVEKIKRNTRVYARKQMTWFRRDDTIVWFTPDDRLKLFAYVEKRLRG